MITRKRNTVLSSLIAGMALIISSVIPGVASAASVGSANGLRVSPVTTNLTLSPGESQVVTVYVQNVTDNTVELQAVVNDFVAAPNNENGIPALLLNPGQYAPTHSLKRFIAPLANVTLGPREQKAISVDITIPKGTSGGGYYGAVRFAPASLDTSKNITLSASVASLILVRVPGNFKEQLNLVSFDVRKGVNGGSSVIFTSGKNLVVAARFQNVGDAQEQPFGKVLLRQDSKQLASYEINDSTPRGNVLPGSIRIFTVNLDHIGTFGKYTVIGNFGYGTSGQLVSGQTTFYIIPVPAILGVLAIVLIILFFIFVFPRMKSAYDRGVLSRARRR